MVWYRTNLVTWKRLAMAVKIVTRFGNDDRYLVVLILLYLLVFYSDYRHKLQFIAFAPFMKLLAIMCVPRVYVH